MARRHLRRKRRTYHSLSSLNHHFGAICHYIERLEHLGFTPIVQMKVFRGLACELQAHINHAVLDKMYAVEERDMYGFGKTRIRWEHHLNPDRPDFSKVERM